ncbi:hypothetical protein Bhyg_09399 [Pseudolycoriella hygida]|uniref:Uncharacterized protein n=1 Tax=Pseudolycoriella hygida TaxID=35572 RepID=A0A9Q0S5V4_9DIPT|nr:hypothetical protein Bhyg_09399 [Pseudolycoriella hygida]
MFFDTPSKPTKAHYKILGKAYRDELARQTTGGKSSFPTEGSIPVRIQYYRNYFTSSEDSVIGRSVGNVVKVYGLAVGDDVVLDLPDELSKADIVMLPHRQGKKIPDPCVFTCFCTYKYLYTMGEVFYEKVEFVDGVAFGDEVLLKKMPGRDIIMTDVELRHDGIPKPYTNYATSSATCDITTKVLRVLEKVTVVRGEIHDYDEEDFTWIFEARH